MYTCNNDQIVDLELLTKSECQEVYSAILNLKNLWIKRHPIVPFYTLGASNYFDIVNNPRLPYYQRAKRYQPIFWEHLGWLYDKLAEVLTQQLKAPISYPEHLALPGFHIFLSHPALEQAKDITHQEWFRHRYDPKVVGSPIHVDTPHLTVDWRTIKNIDFSNPISFTLSITIPQAGAGLHTWDLHIDETKNLSETELMNLFKSREKRLHPYKTGNMILHSGLHYHQVAPIKAQPGEARITLQGHGIFGEGSWQLYW